MIIVIIQILKISTTALSHTLPLPRTLSLPHTHNLTHTLSPSHTHSLSLTHTLHSPLSPSHTQSHAHSLSRTLPHTQAKKKLSRMLFLSKMDEGDGGNQELGGESDDDEVEDDSVRSIRTDIVKKKI